MSENINSNSFSLSIFELLQSKFILFFRVSFLIVALKQPPRHV